MTAPSTLPPYHGEPFVPEVPADLDGYRVTFAGAYFAYPKESQKGSVATGYQVTVLIPEKIAGHPTVNRFKSLAKNYFLKPAIMQKYGANYKRYRTIEVLHVEAYGSARDPRNVEYMTYETLVEYIDREGFQIQPEYYESLGELRQAVVQYVDDPDAFLKTQAAFMARRKKAVDDKMALAALNPSLISAGIPAMVTPLPPQHPNAAPAAEPPAPPSNEPAVVPPVTPEVAQVAEPEENPALDYTKWMARLDSLTVKEATTYLDSLDDLAFLSYVVDNAEKAGTKKAASERIQVLTQVTVPTPPPVPSSEVVGNL